MLRKKLSRAISDTAYLAKRTCMLPLDIAAGVLGGIPPSYYAHDRHEAGLDARRYEDFREEWMAKHNATAEDFYNEFEKPCNRPHASLSANLRHDMICRTGIDIDEEFAKVIAEECREEINKQLKKAKKVSNKSKAKKNKCRNKKRRTKA